jgi:formyltetrahydrofolate hydrolase
VAKVIAATAWRWVRAGWSVSIAREVTVQVCARRLALETCSLPQCTISEVDVFAEQRYVYSDPTTGWFFTRQVVRADSLPFDAEELRTRFSQVAAELGGEADWTVTDAAVPKRAVLLVTREPHCLHDLRVGSRPGSCLCSSRP